MTELVQLISETAEKLPGALPEACAVRLRRW
jgi:hypothetical protein